MNSNPIRYGRWLTKSEMTRLKAKRIAAECAWFGLALAVVSSVWIGLLSVAFWSVIHLLRYFGAI